MRTAAFQVFQGFPRASQFSAELIRMTSRWRVRETRAWARTWRTLCGCGDLHPSILFDVRYHVCHVHVHVDGYDVMSATLLSVFISFFFSFFLYFFRLWNGNIVGTGRIRSTCWRSVQLLSSSSLDGDRQTDRQNRDVVADHGTHAHQEEVHTKGNGRFFSRMNHDMTNERPARDGKANAVFFFTSRHRDNVS